MNKTNYKISQSALNWIKEFEGLSLTAYKCPAGILTIGYGHTKGVKPNQRITREYANFLLLQDIAPCEKYVNNLGVCKTQGQFDALVDFCFNAGQANLDTSTLLKKIKAGAPADEIRAEFKRWVYATDHKTGKKVVLQGLVRRRTWEAQTWIG